MDHAGLSPRMPQSSPRSGQSPRHGALSPTAEIIATTALPAWLSNPKRVCNDPPIMETPGAEGEATMYNIPVGRMIRVLQNLKAKPFETIDMVGEELLSHAVSSEPVDAEYIARRVDEFYAEVEKILKQDEEGKDADADEEADDDDDDDDDDEDDEEDELDEAEAAEEEEALLLSRVSGEDFFDRAKYRREIRRKQEVRQQECEQEDDRRKRPRDDFDGPSRRSPLRPSSSLSNTRGAVSCRHFENGFCRFGQSCKFLHEAPNGAKRR